MLLLLLLQIAGYMRYPWPLLKTLLVVRIVCTADSGAAAAVAAAASVSCIAAACLVVQTSHAAGLLQCQGPLLSACHEFQECCIMHHM
jgi:hypothetical protein